MWMVVLLSGTLAPPMLVFGLSPAAALALIVPPASMMTLALVVILALAIHGVEVNGGS